MKFIQWLLKRFGYTAVKITDVHQYNETIDNQKTEIQDLITHDNDILQQLNEYKKHIESVDFMSCEDYKKQNESLVSENTALKEAKDENEKYYKSVQEQVSKVLRGDEIFKFQNSQALPGCSVVVPRYTKDSVTGKTSILVSGRSIMLDDMTAAIRELPSISEKYTYGMKHLYKYDIVRKIAQMLMNQGAIQMTYGYNTDCTNVELYYAIKCDVPDNPVIMEF